MPRKDYIEGRTAFMEKRKPRFHRRVEQFPLGETTKRIAMKHDRPGVTQETGETRCPGTAVGAIPPPGYAPGQTLVHEFLCRGAGRVPYRAGRDRACDRWRNFPAANRRLIVGRTERIDALSAAFLNAAGANVFDFCDNHVRTRYSSDGAGRAGPSGSVGTAAGEWARTAAGALCSATK